MRVYAFTNVQCHSYKFFTVSVHVILYLSIVFLLYVCVFMGRDFVCALSKCAFENGALQVFAYYYLLILSLQVVAPFVFNKPLYVPCGTARRLQILHDGFDSRF